MSDKTFLLLRTIIEAIEKIELYSDDFDDAETFYHNQKSFDASMMQFVVIAEIIGKLDETFKSEYPEVPWQTVRDFRNLIAHNYFGIDADEVWEIIQTHMVSFKAALEKILNK